MSIIVINSEFKMYEGPFTLGYSKEPQLITIPARVTEYKSFEEIPTQRLYQAHLIFNSETGQVMKNKMTKLPFKQSFGEIKR